MIAKHLQEKFKNFCRFMYDENCIERSRSGLDIYKDFDIYYTSNFDYLKKEYNKRYGENQMNTYFVDVKVVGHWYERYEVEADSMADAKDNWHDGEFIESYEHCGNERDVVEVRQV